MTEQALILMKKAETIHQTSSWCLRRTFRFRSPVREQNRVDANSQSEESKRAHIDSTMHQPIQVEMMCTRQWKAEKQRVSVFQTVLFWSRIGDDDDVDVIVVFGLFPPAAAATAAAQVITHCISEYVTQYQKYN